MSIRHLTAVLRHNTTMPGDADLALREWTALVGSPGTLLTEEALAALYPTRPPAKGPKTATSFSWVAVTWDDVSKETAVNLIRRSAFAQEVFLSGNSDTVTLLKKDVGSPVCLAMCSEPRFVVALAHNYVIESESALPEQVGKDRIATVVKALLEPYSGGGETSLARRLRSAKKTTLALSHDLHIYKAKFFPRMVRALINIYGREGAVFDPFCGSGTALLKAALLGHDSIGVDIDPICEMMSRSKVAPFVYDRANVKNALAAFQARVDEARQSSDFVFPVELAKKIERRDRIDGTELLGQIVAESNILATAIKETPISGSASDLIRTLVSDAVTKKIRYRFVGVGNGRYTIELIKQPLLERFAEKMDRAFQLLDVFDSLETELGIVLGRVRVEKGDARDEKSWPELPHKTFVVTSPPYLPASSGREHYASSRALAFTVLGLSADANGYFDSIVPPLPTPSFANPSEAGRLMTYLFSDASEDADPQKDAMRFERKAIPTAYYLGDIGRFASSLVRLGSTGRVAMVVADQHTFYSHRRGEVEHVVDCASLYGEILAAEGLTLTDEIELQLLKSSASRARPPAKDDYHEAVLIFSTSGKKTNEAHNSSAPSPKMADHSADAA